MLVAQSCLTLCDPIDCSLPSYSVHGILQARILEWIHSLLQAVFPTQEFSMGVLNCRQILCYQNHKGSPISSLLTSKLDTEKLNKSFFSPFGLKFLVRHYSSPFWPSNSILIEVCFFIFTADISSVQSLSRLRLFVTP